MIFYLIKAILIKKEVIKIKIKKVMYAFLCIISCISISNMHAHCTSEAKNWYLKYNSAGEHPSTPDNGKYADKYNAIYLDRSGEKSIYLTFDAGYENGNVAKILDTLKKHDVPGAFFVLPNLIKSNPDLLSRMNDEGHLICNHTRSHRNMAKITDINQFRKELEDNEKILRDELGYEMAKYYRPPEGAYSELNLSQANELGYTTVFWSLAYADWDNDKQIDGDKALELLLSRVHPGCVLLLHPTSETNANILDRFITDLKDRGYSFKSLNDFPNKKIESDKYK